MSLNCFWLPQESLRCLFLYGYNMQGYKTTQRACISMCCLFLIWKGSFQGKFIMKQTCCNNVDSSLLHRATLDEVRSTNSQYITVLWNHGNQMESISSRLQTRRDKVELGTNASANCRVWLSHEVRKRPQHICPVQKKSTHHQLHAPLNWVWGVQTSKNLKSSKVHWGNC